MISLSTLPNSSTRKRAMVSEEQVQQNLEKRTRQMEEAPDAVTRAQWRPIDPKTECFLIDELPSSQAFMALNICRPDISYLEIFLKFVTDSIADRLFASISDDDKILSHTKKGYLHRFTLIMPNIWQTLAVQVMIIGNQVKSSENDPKHRLLRNKVYTALTAFVDALPSGYVTRCEVIERLFARMTLGEEYSAEISKNFRSIIHQLGQYVAGDEKLLHFTGKSGNVRLVISKPDRVGFWFYELCGRFASGLPFMIDVFMHNSLRGPVPISSVVEGWINTMQEIHVKSGHTDLKCYLAMDSYYMDTSVRELCEEKGIYYCCSVNEKNFAAEVSAVRPVGTTDQIGQWHGLYNENTEQLFVYHYDAQKGARKKYNFSHGFKRSTDKLKIHQHQNRIPAHDNYKTFFECCDNFNHSLKDKSWPHKRGGKGVLGENGTHHDFLMACILQNTFNAWHEATGAYPANTSFKNFCNDLAIQLFVHSQTYVVNS